MSEQPAAQCQISQHVKALFVIQPKIINNNNLEHHDLFDVMLYYTLLHFITLLHINRCWAGAAAWLTGAAVQCMQCIRQGAYIHKCAKEACLAYLHSRPQGCRLSLGMRLSTCIHILGIFSSLHAPKHVGVGSLLESPKLECKHTVCFVPWRQDLSHAWTFLVARSGLTISSIS